MTRKRVIAVWFAYSSVSTLSGAGWVGASTCAACHPAQARRQAVTGHAGALRRASDHPLSDLFFREREKTRQPGFRFEFLQGPLVRVSGAGAAVDVSIQWAFGAGDQAVTFVSRVDRRNYVELFFSYYRAMHGLAATPGQQDLKPAGLGEAVGLYYKTRDPALGIDGCFACHSTGPIKFDADGSIRPRELGVRCEDCHGPGESHVAAAKRRDPATRRLIDNPGQWSPERQVELCGKCHRAPRAPSGEIDFNYPWNIRHQPPYLIRSACFLRTGSLSCVTCHEPHEPINKTASSYNQKCGVCHRQTPQACGGNCVDCHMPRVSPQPPLRFTNHWIGVYRSANKLRPLEH